jgi:hypothetical protein
MARGVRVARITRVVARLDHMNTGVFQTSGHLGELFAQHGPLRPLRIARVADNGAFGEKDVRLGIAGSDRTQETDISRGELLALWQRADRDAEVVRSQRYEDHVRNVGEDQSSRRCRRRRWRRCPARSGAPARGRAAATAARTRSRRQASPAASSPTAGAAWRRHAARRRAPLSIGRVRPCWVPPLRKQSRIPGRPEPSANLAAARQSPAACVRPAPVARGPTSSRASAFHPS